MNADDYMNSARSLWGRFPEQMRRLPILAVLVVAALIAVRVYLVPTDFGEYGHYRAAALSEIAALDIRYAGHQACVECHDDIDETKAGGYHKGLACEICHGPAAAHVAAEGDVELRVPRKRGFCPLCHEYRPSRPTGFPQIVSASHNPMKPCITCHNPHDPVPPQTPAECEACHGTIARTKALSAHVYVPCTRCHEAQEEHKTLPRRFLPTRPADRAFCGGCHARRAPGNEDVKKIDMAEHGPGYVCWQCHYPHNPEVR